MLTWVRECENDNHPFDRAMKDQHLTHSVKTVLCFQQMVSESSCHLLCFLTVWSAGICSQLAVCLNSCFLFRELQSCLSDHSFVLPVSLLSCKGHSGSLKNLLCPRFGAKLFNLGFPDLGLLQQTRPFSEDLKVT